VEVVILPRDQQEWQAVLPHAAVGHKQMVQKQIQLSNFLQKSKEVMAEEISFAKDRP
jgi:hypothetical protein